MEEISKYQKCESIQINRIDIKNAPYNPRKISKQNFNKLKKVIKEKGLVNTITWNKRTGNLVGGHQRIKVLDILHKTDKYSLVVSKIDVDEKEEKQLNIMLNNDNLQGEYDIDLLKSFKDDFNFIDDLMFDRLEVEFIFEGEEGFNLYEENNDSNKLIQEVKEYKKDENGKDALDKIKEQRKNYREKVKEADSAEFYIIVVFPSEKATNDFKENHGILLSERYISSTHFEEIISPSSKQ